jgi:hypothetical protein
MRALTVVLLLSLLSCIQARQTTYRTQTGDNALDCALSYGVNNGYMPAAGGTNGGFVRLERRVRSTIDLTGRELDVLTVTVSGAQLQVDASGFNSDGAELGASGEVKREATEILQRCGAADSKEVR